ncbi:MAG: DUF3536 domain-containing protein [Acidobacteria bacterium]|jgi:hypothetical protein|nr:MAG: DUF3536 domain-containing protein [Acidobacteriota bacterium]
MSFFCLHCHFHQPPRENPYLGLIPIEESAYPFENWNERIFRECYLPNLYAHYRSDGKLLKVVNNYGGVSFNFTHSLLSWLAREKPWFVEKLKASSKNALASGFNHTILPLDPKEDREVQIVWGIRSFEHFFGRKPRGFWLPELAVDRATLSLLVRHGIKYVILAPHQVKVKGSFLRHYLPEGHIDIFVYDGELSHGFAFGDLLRDVSQVIGRTLDSKRLTLVAVDGETFGHHKKFGEMGLAYLLENHPRMKTLEEVYDLLRPDMETEIKELTSWSCAHGIERWHSDCGCTTGDQPGWHQKWRRPLREALEFLRSAVKERLLLELHRYFKDPWEGVLDFINVILGGSKEEYFSRHLKAPINKEERVKLLKLLNAYMYVHLSFSSDGWFFAEISQLEPVKNLLFAKFALDLIGDSALEEGFVRLLSQAPSNLRTYGNGLGVWERLVKTKSLKVEDLIKSLVVLELSDVIPQEGMLGRFYYRVEGFEPWKVYIKDRETEEEYEGMEKLREFESGRVPQPLLKWLLEKWSLDYGKEDVEFTKHYQALLEDLISYSKDTPFDLKDELKGELETHYKIRLYIALKKEEDFDRAKELLDRADSLGLSLKDQKLKLWIENYISRKVLKGLLEEEAYKIAGFVKEYNRSVGKYELMVDLWELKNWAWERKESIKNVELLGLLDLHL